MNPATTKNSRAMSQIKENPKVSKLETASIVVGAIATLLGFYFIFITSSNEYRLTNIIIAVAFLVFVAYNFYVGLNSKGIRRQLEDSIFECNQLKDSLENAKRELNGVKNQLELAESELENVKKALAEAREDGDVE